MGRDVGKVLNHPARKRTVELLGSRGPLSWKELSTELGVATGALYYHLDALEGLVTRTPDKKYCLTKQGGQIFSSLTSNPASSPEELLAAVSSRSRVAAAIEGVFAPRSLMQKAGSQAPRSIAASLVLSAALLLDMAYLNFGVRLFYFQSAGLYGAVEDYVASLVIIFVVSYAASALIFRARPGPSQLAFGCVLSFVPVAALASAFALFPSLGASRPVSTALFVFFQAWSATILAAGVSVSTAVRVEKTLVVGLILLYATMATIFL